MKNISKRTVIIFGIFILVALTGSIFIYFYHNYADLIVSKYISKITICGNIVDEEACYEKDFCEGIYGPTCPNCQDNTFRRCQRLPLSIRAQFETEKTLCDQTAGEWYSSKLGNFCLCQQPGTKRTFDKKLGCIEQ
jgi:hypothetical protein